VEFRLLGPVEVRLDDRVVDIGPPQQRHVLAVLAAEVGRPITSELLIDRVWDEAPSGARRTLHVYVTRLRRLLTVGNSTDVPVPRRSGGYVLDVEPDQVDLHRFRNLLDQARRCPDEEQIPLLRKALGLWAGEPLAGLPGGWAHRMRQACREQYLDAMLVWAQAELRAGNPTAIIGPLTEVIVENPLVEPLCVVLMRALHAAGRTGDALDRYDDLRRRLADELGADPSAEVHDTYQAIVRNDVVTAPRPAPARSALLPAQLPADVRGFVARDQALRRLDDLLDGTVEHPAGAVISIFSGTAGVGKTALALHWAHRVRQRFPDGQLHVNLQGFDGGGSPMDSTEAIRLFLDALGVSAEAVPADPAAAAALYRTLLSHRRVLILLDNAGDAAQVRPLLPGAAGCLVLITSRDALAGLVAGEDAHPLPVDLFSADEARELLVRRLGEARVAAEPAAVDEIVARCAQLPLALVVVAARAAAHPGFPLARLAEELRVSQLDALGAGDPATDVRTVFSWSYRRLSPDAARLFRFLGLHPGPDISAPAVASLAGLPTRVTRLLLAELTRAHLLSEHSPSRYAFHDLLRHYAAELTLATDSQADRVDAVHRVLDHYLHTGDAAARLVEPHRDSPVSTPPPPAVAIEPLDDARHALDWFTAERQLLLAVVRLAADTGFDQHAWQLARVFAGLLDNQGRWLDLIAMQRVAIEATRRLGEQTQRAWSYRFLGRAYASLHRYEEANAAYQCAVELYEQLADPAGQAAVHFALACLAESRGGYDTARRHSGQALRLYTAAGNKLGRARALNLVGWVDALHRDFALSLIRCRRALGLQEELDDRVGQAATWDSIGYVHYHQAEYNQARDCYERSLALFRHCGDRYNEADVLIHLGDTYRAAGQPDAARETWRMAHDICADLGDPGDPGAQKVRARLADLDPPSKSDELPPPASAADTDTAVPAPSHSGM
jgi:DNA-binding SARP family transcriptional activator/tetratricopeptide (TPR) repeat protein